VLRILGRLGGVCNKKIASFSLSLMFYAKNNNNDVLGPKKD